LGKPASLYATTGFLASNVYAGQHPKPQQKVPKSRKPYTMIFSTILSSRIGEAACRPKTHLPPARQA